MTIVVTTFALTPETSVDVFVAADARFQQEVAYQQPGLRRRTTARADDGQWCVIERWAGPAGASGFSVNHLGSMVTNVDQRTYEALD